MEDFYREIASLRGSLVSELFWLRARRLGDLLRKANFNPNQPRVPAGEPDGGQWTLVGGSGYRPPDDPSEPPKFPEQEPPTRTVNAIAQAVARYLVKEMPSSVVVDIFLNVNWLAQNVKASIQSYLDGPKSLEQLQIDAETPLPGYNIHHIVEQGSARIEGFAESLIEASENKVRIPVYKHWQITGWYARSNPQFGGISPREFLRNEPWDVKRATGLQALRDAGVLK
ncbi:MAG: hypothetical protein JNL61_14260 [Rhizobiaceae bacterium]|nr:hypothetical protein [Rhizobiaceae bacterium]